MSEPTRAAKRFRGVKVSARVVCLLIVLVSFAGIVAIQRAGFLQFLEFQAYDLFIRTQDDAHSTGPIVLVEMTEKDIQNPSLDYPIHDDKLADLLTILESQEPTAIGVDIWRDIPVPKNGVGRAKLNEVLKANGNICAIFTLPLLEKGGIRAPEALDNDVGRIAFNDNFPVDHGVDDTIPKVRRCMLVGKDQKSDSDFFSLPFWLALRFLQEKKGAEVEFGPDEIHPEWLKLGKTTLPRFKPSDGAYVDADAGKFQMLLDFKCPDSFSRYTVSAALSGKIPPNALRGKIVIVGINTASVLDERVTPIKRDHRGIEVQAGTVNQLLRYAINGDKPLRVWADWQEYLWILLWCAIGGIIGYRLHSPWLFVLESVACLLAIGGIAWLSFLRGFWIPTVAPALAYVPSAILVTAYMISHERSMRAILMKIYSRHVSKEIAEEVWANRDSFLDGHRPVAQKLVVTVLFTDLKGFSTISERMQPPELYGWLNGYLGAMAQIVEAEHGGSLKQFTGDGILALFGIPVPHTTRAEQTADATAAVKCALAMGKRLIELTREWKEAGLPLVSMRAGIYTGEVAAGTVGADERFEYAVIGDVVNTASRLESYDKTLADPDLLPNRCRILIGEPTHNLLDGKFVSEQIGALQVKGKANKVSVFIVKDEKRDSPASAPVPSVNADACLTS